MYILYMGKFAQSDRSPFQKKTKKTTHFKMLVCCDFFPNNVMILLSLIVIKVLRPSVLMTDIVIPFSRSWRSYHLFTKCKQILTNPTDPSVANPWKPWVTNMFSLARVKLQRFSSKCITWIKVKFGKKMNLCKIDWFVLR